MSDDAGFGALNGLRVIELGQLIAGPFCGQLMADHGAEVIKVEAPEREDPMRHWGQKGPLWWPIISRNKKLSIRCPVWSSSMVTIRTSTFGDGVFILRRYVFRCHALYNN